MDKCLSTKNTLTWYFSLSAYLFNSFILESGLRNFQISRLNNDCQYFYQISSIYIVCVSGSHITLNFIHSDKATKFCEIFTLLLTVYTVVKSKVRISQNFVASSEYMNFKIQICIRVDRYDKTTRKTMTSPTTANFLHFRCLRFSNLGTWDLKKKLFNFKINDYRFST